MIELSHHSGSIARAEKGGKVVDERSISCYNSRILPYPTITLGTEMPQIEASTLIKDVLIVTFKDFGDERGRFFETFRKAWFPQRTWEHVQVNRSVSRAGVLRGLHYHFRQVDYWFVVAGKIRAALHDLRPASPTYGLTETVQIGDCDEKGLFIPVGVAHGFVALTDAILIYVVDNYYDSTDEYGLAWNDPDVAIPWGVESPILSPRDANNPLLRDIPPENLPRK